MKSVSFFLVLMLVFSVNQWPGYFYSFTLTDKAGKLITVHNSNYKIKIINPETYMVINVSLCNDSTTLRFYAGGNHGLENTHLLQIQNVITNEIMVIKFPSSLSGGNDKYYRNLFAGDLNFKKEIYQIKLPSTDSAWNNLKEKHFCPDYGGNDSYWDISFLQHQ